MTYNVTATGYGDIVKFFVKAEDILSLIHI